MLRSVGHARRFAPYADPKQRALSGLAGQPYQLRITGILGSSRSGRRALRDTAAAYALRCGKLGRPPCGEAKALPSDARAATPRRSVHIDAGAASHALGQPRRTTWARPGWREASRSFA